jgi:hypothetical protein
MKLQEQADWGLLHGIMKSSSLGKQKLDTEENEKSLTMKDMTGDYFYDHISKFCNQDAPALFHQIQSSFHEDAIDNSVDIPEE